MSFLPTVLSRDEARDDARAVTNRSSSRPSRPNKSEASEQSMAKAFAACVAEAHSEPTPAPNRLGKKPKNETSTDPEVAPEAVPVEGDAVAVALSALPPREGERRAASGTPALPVVAANDSDATAPPAVALRVALQVAMSVLTRAMSGDSTPTARDERTGARDVGSDEEDPAAATDTATESKESNDEAQTAAALLALLQPRVAPPLEHHAPLSFDRWESPESANGPLTERSAAGGEAKAIETKTIADLGNAPAAAVVAKNVTAAATTPAIPSATKLAKPLAPEMPKVPAKEPARETAAFYESKPPSIKIAFPGARVPVSSSTRDSAVGAKMSQMPSNRQESPSISASMTSSTGEVDAKEDKPTRTTRRLEATESARSSASATSTAVVQRVTAVEAGAATAAPRNDMVVPAKERLVATSDWGRPSNEPSSYVRVAAAAIDRAALRRESQGTIDDPLLGRVTVTARTVPHAGGGILREGVAVEVRAEKSSTTETLRGQAAALDAELRHDDVNLRSLRIESETSGRSLDRHGSGDPSRDPQRQPSEGASRQTNAGPGGQGTSTNGASTSAKSAPPASNAGDTVKISGRVRAIL